MVNPEKPWEGTDRDYLYEELLSRVFHTLRESNPELAGEKRKTILKIPEVLREGTKKTVFVNLVDICKMMHRQPEHVMTFLLAELGTSGSLDGQQRLVVKGRFAPKSFEGILRRYMSRVLFALIVVLEAKVVFADTFSFTDEYVICNSCKGGDTRIEKDKENRLIFLKCDKVPNQLEVSVFVRDRTCFFACQTGSSWVLSLLINGLDIGVLNGSCARVQSDPNPEVLDEPKPEYIVIHLDLSTTV
ncbi:putative translation initiation factor IF2/IF5 [Helianthus annuus]|nr:putative translation initiation factor IF2/IF5 [Helianthus annuus]